MSESVVLVTGGSSGIGRAICTFLSAKGYRVFGTTRNLDKYQQPQSFTLLEMDVSKQDTVANAVAAVKAQAGRLDILINNAGVGITGPLEETPLEEVHHAFETNLYGPLRVAQAVLPGMREQGSGFILNITSIAGFMGLPYRGVYSASKGALEVAMEALRMEVKAFGIKVSCLAPGDFATNIAAGRYHVPAIPESPYPAYQKTLEMINEDVDEASDPILVAKKVYAILQKTKPKVHYAVGEFMQKLSLGLKRILPDKIFEKLLLNHYKL